ncbi:MAG: hypothetical protein ACREA0_16885, partial [bacterium]
CVVPKDDDSAWFEAFVDLGALFLAAWDAIAQVIEDIKAFIVNIAGKIVEGITFGYVNCGPGTACQGALMAGLEAGLIAMGVPPSLPNFKQLMQQGTDYLIAEMMKASGLDALDALCKTNKTAFQKKVSDQVGNETAKKGAKAGAKEVTGAIPCPGDLAKKFVDKLVAQVEVNKSKSANGGFMGLAVADPQFAPQPASVVVSYHREVDPQSSCAKAST